jgi:hypothetical protein
MTRAYNTATTQQNSGGAVAPFVAGKNKVLNSDFSIWQRGTSFTNPTDNTYVCDRIKQNGNGSGFTKIWSRQTFTPGTAPVAGYESAFFFRFNQTVAGTGGTNNNIAIYMHEDVRTFAGQTVTLSFWAKADASRSLSLFYGQEFNGGSSDQYPSISSVTLTTSWTRYTFTFTVASLAGKTIGSGFTGNFQLIFNAANNLVQTIDIWGVQLEAGSVATPFQTATGNPQAELAACQRYFCKSYSIGLAPGASTNDGIIYSGGNALTTTTGYLGALVEYPVTMRATPTVTTYDTSYTSGKVSRVTPGGSDQANLTPSGNLANDKRITILVSSGNAHTGLGFHYIASAEL